MVEVILGIHSNVAGDTNEFIAGHAWITVHQSSSVKHYGLWPDNHPRVLDNGKATDIRIGMEAADTPAASRYYLLTEQQATRLSLLLNKVVAWGYTHNCSSWASDVVWQVVKEDVDADDWGGIETPRELGRSIMRLEAKDPTSIGKPKHPIKHSTFQLFVHQDTYFLFDGRKMIDRAVTTA